MENSTLASIIQKTTLEPLRIRTLLVLSRIELIYWRGEDHHCVTKWVENMIFFALNNNNRNLQGQEQDADPCQNSI